MSQASQPSAVISARLIGRNGAALPECARWRGQEIKGFSAQALVSMAPTHTAPAPRIQAAGIARWLRWKLMTGNLAAADEHQDRVPSLDACMLPDVVNAAVAVMRKEVECGHEIIAISQRHKCSHLYSGWRTI
jgi:hypothetical protein